MSELADHIATLDDAGQRKQCEALLEEMGRETSMGNFDRLAAYLVLSDDMALGHEQKVSLALGGWLVGSDYAERNLPITLSLVKARELVRRYMNEPVLLKRNEIEAELRSMEAVGVQLVARLISHMQPPLETPEPSRETPGFYKLQVPIGIDREPDATYYVQLPPEYDPYVRYPTIVTLNGLGATPENQIDWWAGVQGSNGIRLGQATRHGYIVIAVDWQKEGQREYGFTAREHAVVLASLRDACRRFSINTDRVFLSGHSMGGDAAWDLGLAHPDLWAGVIPIVAVSRKYCNHYWQNAAMLPFYVVAGELDGDKIVENARDLDRYMRSRYDVTVVEYEGAATRTFTRRSSTCSTGWAAGRRGDFAPKEFEVSTMRTWDNYFWWLEVGDLPAKTIVEPSNWPPARGVRAAQLRGKVLADGDLSVPSSVNDVTLWLSAELLPPGRRSIHVTIGGRRSNVQIQPDLSVLLDDVRTRGDRLHPFWAKIAQ